MNVQMTQHHLNSTFDVNDIEPPIVNDNCDSDISYDVSHNVDTSTVGVYFVTFTASDSISENNFENMFVYPNPVKDILNIQNVYSNSTISLSDILGKNYEINIINDFENNRLSLNMSNLEKGIYFIRIQDINTGQLKTLRLIKQ